MVLSRLSPPPTFRSCDQIIRPGDIQAAGVRRHEARYWRNADYKVAGKDGDSALLPAPQPLLQLWVSSGPPGRELADRAICGGLCGFRSRLPGSFEMWLLSPWSSIALPSPSAATTLHIHARVWKDQLSLTYAGDSPIQALDLLGLFLSTAPH